VATLDRNPIIGDGVTTSCASGLMSQRRGSAESSHLRHRNRLVGSTQSELQELDLCLKPSSACQRFDMLQLNPDLITQFLRILSLACHRCSIDYT
jgi:hypothetical protein